MSEPEAIEIGDDLRHQRRRVDASVSMRDGNTRSWRRNVAVLYGPRLNGFRGDRDQLVELCLREALQRPGRSPDGKLRRRTLRMMAGLRGVTSAPG